MDWYSVDSVVPSFNRLMSDCLDVDILSKYVWDKWNKKQDRNWKRPRMEDKYRQRQQGQQQQQQKAVNLRHGQFLHSIACQDTSPPICCQH